jgi:hypothetical protein
VDSVYHQNLEVLDMGVKGGCLHLWLEIPDRCQRQPAGGVTGEALEKSVFNSSVLPDWNQNHPDWSPPRSCYH